MKHKDSMQKAYREKDAEFYTLYEDIAAELPKYKEQLRGKRIICPCDWDESYNEELVYKEEGVTASDLFARPDGSLLLSSDKEGSVQVVHESRRGLSPRPHDTHEVIL